MARSTPRATSVTAGSAAAGIAHGGANDSVSFATQRSRGQREEQGILRDAFAWAQGEKITFISFASYSTVVTFSLRRSPL